MSKYIMSWDEVIDRVEKLNIQNEVIYPIPRGGMLACYAFLNNKHCLIKNNKFTTNPASATLFFDDIIDSSTTKNKWLTKYPEAKFVAIVDKTQDDKDMPWCVFPWEESKENDYEDNIIRILEHNEVPVTNTNKDIVRSNIGTCCSMLRVFND